MTTSDPDRVTLRDPTVMRALAHPARISIMEYLGDGNEATATEAAEVVGLSPSATSYHLRALARAGLIEEAPGRGDGRERVWRSAMSTYTVDTGDDNSDEARAAALKLVGVVLDQDEARARRWFARAHTEPEAWSAAAALMRTRLMVTPDELTALLAALGKLVEPYRVRDRVDVPEGARAVSLLLRAFPLDEV